MCHALRSAGICRRKFMFNFLIIKMTKKLKNTIDFISNIATIVNCITAIIGVTFVVNFVVEIRPIMNDSQDLKDSENIPFRDTVVIRQNIITTDTVVVYRDVFKRDTIFIQDNRVKSNTPVTNVTSEERERIKKDEEDFRKKYPEIFR